MKSGNHPYAMLAGIAILVMTVTAGFSFAYVHSKLIITQEPQITFENLSSSATLFAAGVGSWLIVFICDLIVCWALYHYFISVHRNLSLLSSVLRLIYTAVFCVAITHLVLVLPMIEKGSTAKNVMMIYAHLQDFEQIWSAGLIIFGLHLLALAYLVLLSSAMPRILGGLLALAGICYLVVHIGQLFLPDYRLMEQIEMILSLPMAVGEVGFALWLLVRRRRAKPISAWNSKINCEAA